MSNLSTNSRPAANLVFLERVSRDKRLPHFLSVLLGHSLAFMSNQFFSAIQWLRMRHRRLFRLTEKSGWVVLNERLDKFLVVPYFMNTAPRWNTHAVIFGTEPLLITDGLQFELESLNQSAQVWSLIIHDSINMRTITSFSSSDSALGTVNLDLASGFISVGLRLYRPSAEITLPALYSGGSLLVPALEQFDPYRVEHLGQAIFHRSSTFYALLHSPLLQALKTATNNMGEAAFTALAGKYLPAGDPGTLYLFGYLPKKVSVEIDTSAVAEDECLVFVTTYNHCSFPELSQTIELGERTLLARTQHEGSILIRIVPLGQSERGDISLLERISVRITDFNSTKSPRLRLMA